MVEPKIPLPPFAALRAFHAAAARGRFRDAAEALGVTESAISHQVRRLEDFLRVALFDRSGSGVRLTAAGRRYLDQIDPAIRQIQAATEALLQPGGRTVVRVTAPPSLAASWLIPQLGAFERAHPDIELQLVATTRVLDLRRDQVDLAIRHGKGAWPGIEAGFLLEETALPVAAPGYLELASGEDPQAALRRVRLIVNTLNPDEWEEWARARGLVPPDLSGALELESAEQVLQVAEGGHGLALGRRPVVDDRLARGSLVAPFGAGDPTGAAHYLCRAAGAAPTTAARRVERWLHGLAGTT
ncbi:LysR family transcriptional regulator, glycine cleavage system transcriptional activator [Tistlia consotensis]|uniref:LysR family transcriptional regulator, glycine cleavage system transcriptional activator n=2 Tax=Tistlia TaxID=1321364 RepID=A0A1Y6BP64_9PROT|nr:LysR family transcriptional regulator, glycine cleavage system transcriptional activator [Tistlia consotensis USBA 355]SNR50785.1 LysR family transcriptional regulator, glycine cleavage system transcriptional activator [Tistlia consotensis]